MSKKLTTRSNTNITVQKFYQVYEFFNFFRFLGKPKRFSHSTYLYQYSDKKIVSVTFLKKMIFEKISSYQIILGISPKYSSFFPLIHWNVVLSVPKKIKIMVNSGIRKFQFRHPNHSDTRHTFYRTSTTLQILSLRIVGSSRKSIKIKISITFVKFYLLNVFLKENIYCFH